MRKIENSKYSKKLKIRKFEKMKIQKRNSFVTTYFQTILFYWNAFQYMLEGNRNTTTARL